MCIANMLDPLMKKVKPGFLSKLDIGQRLTKSVEKSAGFVPPRGTEIVPSTSLRYTNPSLSIANSSRQRG